MANNEFSENKFYNRYFDYVGESESPIIYHRWTAISAIAAFLGRQIYFPFGHNRIYPNFYIMLVGSPGARKNTAMTPARRALVAAGYKKFAPDRVSPERFIAEMIHINTFDTLDDEEIEKLNFHEPNEIYAMIGEFADFLKKGNIDFMNLLTNLWDNLPEYKHPKFHGKSIFVCQPTVNIETGTTPQSLASTLPIEAIGQGYLSRNILVYGENSGTKITIPKEVPDSIAEEFSLEFKTIKEKVSGRISFSLEAKEILDRLYHEFEDIDDYRFKHYSTRRLVHLIKLCMIFAAMRLSVEVSKQDILQANTLLTATEARMPKALGEFGKAANSDVANTVLDIIRTSKNPINQQEIWKHVAHDLNKMGDLIEILKSLIATQKIQQITIGKKTGLVGKNVKINGWKKELLVDGFLTSEEEI